MPLKKTTLHETVLVYCAPHPMPDTISRRTDFIQVPLGTPPGFPVTEFVGEQGTEWDAPLTACLVADPDAALVEQLLNILIAERKAVVQLSGRAE